MTNKQILKELTAQETTLADLTKALKNHQIAILRLMQELEG